jgi:hypothetical protein
MRVAELDGMDAELAERGAANAEEQHRRGLGAVFEIESAFAAVIASPGPCTDCGSTQAIGRTPGIQHS